MTAIFTKQIRTVLFLYAIVFVHECFHLMATQILKVPIKGIRIMPYGITLKIKSHYISQPEHEIIIATAGPFANILMIIFALILKSYCPVKPDDMIFFVFANTVIAAVNLIPALPLDGGRILKAALTLKWGFIKAANFTLKITEICIVILFIGGIWLLYVTHFNLSLFIISFFLTWNMLGERRNIRVIVSKDIIYCKEKLLNKGIVHTKHIAALYDMPARKLLHHFSYNFFYLITVIDHNMNVIGTLTEVQIIEGLVRLGSHVRVGEIMESVSKGSAF